MIFTVIVLKFPILFYKIEVIITKKYSAFNKNGSGYLTRRTLSEKIIGIAKVSIASVNLRSERARYLSGLALFYLEQI